ncbi:MAG: hypothetical protein H8E37_05220 [Planctomycetes bacterium]|nr:hypothetical protein [Planctomycetota bacterium]
MNRSVLSVFVLLFLGVLFAFPGCGGDEKPGNEGGETGGEATSGESPEGNSTTAETGSEKPGHEGHNHETELPLENSITGPRKPIAMARTPKRDRIAGRWLMRFVQIIENEEDQTAPQMGERPVMLISITPGEAETTGSILHLAGVEQPFLDPELIDVKAVGDQVLFTGTNREGDPLFDFSGSFVDGVVIGSIGYANGAVLPARLVPTDERTLARIPGFVPFAALPEFIRLQQQSLIPEQTMQFAKDHPASPLCRMAYLGLVQSHLGRKRPVKEVEAVIEAAVNEQWAWGERCVLQTRHQILQFLNQTGYDAEFSLKYLAELEKLPTPKDLGVDVETPNLTPIRQQIAFRRAYEELQSKDPAVKKQGRVHCEELLKEMPYNAFMLQELANDYRVAGDLEKAISLYAEIKALPMQETLLESAFANAPVKRISPSQRLNDLWKQAKREDDLDNYITSIYDAKLLGFAGEPVESRPDGKGNRVVLAEMFTSSNSPESVAGDLVISALEKTYPRTMFVALRYHQHAHAPDPLANQDGEARVYNYYRFPGAPLLVLNGENAGTIRGAMNQTIDVHKRAQKLVDERLAQETEVTVELSASQQEDSIHIQTQVNGADLENEHLRLRIVLAESNINYTGFNSVRKHDMVARLFVGGEGGVAAVDGMLKFEGTVDLAAARKNLTEYLTEFEKGQDQKFPSKPVDLKQLSVVAFVQDDTTRQVLQTSIVSLNPSAAE